MIARPSADTGSATRTRRGTGVWAWALVAMLVLAVVSVVVGSRSLDIATVWSAIVDYDPTNDAHLTVWLLRIPRTLLVILTGAALGVAGAVMQAMTRNPLAEPGLLGVNAGAAAAVVTGLLIAGSVGIEWYIWFAFLGAALAAMIVYALGGALSHATNPVRLVLAGAALSIVLGAYTSAVMLNFPRVFDTFRFWDAGSFQGRSWDVLAPVLVAIVAGIVIALTIAAPLNALALGPEFGQALGASPRRTWILAGIAVVLLAGGATAAAGPIAFIGLTAPQAARALVGPNYRRLLPAAAFLAAVLLLVADIIGRVLVLPSELQASIVSALIGAPVFIALVRRKRMPTL